VILLNKYYLLYDFIIKARAFAPDFQTGSKGATLGWAILSIISLASMLLLALPLKTVVKVRVVIVGGSKREGSEKIGLV